MRPTPSKTIENNKINVMQGIALRLIRSLCVVIYPPSPPESYFVFVVCPCLFPGKTYTVAISNAKFYRNYYRYKNCMHTRQP